MLQLSVALLRLAVASSMASYLVRDEYCGTPLAEGVDLMGAPTVASAGAALAVDAAGAVALTSEKFARYVEYVLESADGFASCDGAVGCGGTRWAVRRFRGSPAAGRAGGCATAARAFGSPGARRGRAPTFSVRFPGPRPFHRASAFSAMSPFGEFPFGCVGTLRCRSVAYDRTHRSP